MLLHPIEEGRDGHPFLPSQLEGKEAKVSTLDGHLELGLPVCAESARSISVYGGAHLGFIHL